MEEQEEMFSSPMFTFIVGPDERTFHTHSLAISRLSNVFGVMMNGEMQEAVTKTAYLKDTEAEVFMSFLHFCYKGDYPNPPFFDENKGEMMSRMEGCGDKLQVLSPKGKQKAQGSLMAVHTAANTSRPSPHPVRVPPPSPPGLARRQILQPSSIRAKRESVEKKPKVPDIAERRRQFGTRKYTPRISFQNFADACHVRLNSATHEDYSPVLLHHASLYIFGERYDVPDLQELALQKLYTILSGFTLSRKRVIDIVKLLELAYSDDVICDAEESIDPLRDLLISFVVCEIETIARDKVFMDFAREGGEFVTDFFRASVGIQKEPSDERCKNSGNGTASSFLSILHA